MGFEPIHFNQTFQPKITEWRIFAPVAHCGKFHFFNLDISQWPKCSFPILSTVKDRLAQTWGRFGSLQLKWFAAQYNWARQESVGQEISEVSFVCFMHHFISWTLFISRINRASLHLNDSHRQPNNYLAQLAEWWSGGCGFKPHWGQFLMKFILFCVTLDLSDNLTEMHITKN